MTQRTCHSIDIGTYWRIYALVNCNDLGEFCNIFSDAYCFQGYKALIAYYILAFMAVMSKSLLPVLVWEGVLSHFIVNVFAKKSSFWVIR